MRGWVMGIVACAVLAAGGAGTAGTLGSLCDDQVLVGVDQGVIHISHSGAEYNCCPDGAVFSVGMPEGGRLEVIEVMVVTAPCRCVCCTDLAVDVSGLNGGTYELHFLWMDNDSPWWQEHVEQVVVPGLGLGLPVIAGSEHACGDTVPVEPRTWGAIKGVFR